MSTFCVNVKDFGAVGETLTTNGNIEAGAKDLDVVNAGDGWVEGAGIEIKVDGNIFKTRLAAIVGCTFHLQDPSPFSAFGATVTNDDSIPIQAAYDAVKTAGGKICIPPGRYRCTDTLNLDNNLNRIVFEGTGGRNSPNVLEYTPDSGHLITLHSSQNVNFRQMGFAYSNPAYAADLVDLDWSDKNADSAYIDFDDCFFKGTESAKNARSLLRLNHAIICTVNRCGFIWTNIGILGQDPVYSNAHTITGCTFNNCDEAAIKNPGEAWTILNCTFEPDS